MSKKQDIIMSRLPRANANTGPTSLADVECFKCGKKGHFANECTKGKKDKKKTDDDEEE